MLSITSKLKVHTLRPGHRLCVTQRRQQWLHWRLPQVLGNDGMFSAKITFLFWLMAPSLLPPVRSPGDRMWLKALSTRRGIYFLPVCSDLFTREVTLWFSDPGSAIGRRRLAWPGGAARSICDTLPSDPIIHDWRGWPEAPRRSIVRGGPGLPDHAHWVTVGQSVPA